MSVPCKAPPPVLFEKQDQNIMMLAWFRNKGERSSFSLQRVCRPLQAVLFVLLLFKNHLIPTITSSNKIDLILDDLEIRYHQDMNFHKSFTINLILNKYFIPSTMASRNSTVSCTECSSDVCQPQRIRDMSRWCHRAGRGRRRVGGRSKQCQQEDQMCHWQVNIWGSSKVQRSWSWYACIWTEWYYLIVSYTVEPHYGGHHWYHNLVSAIVRFPL